MNTFFDGMKETIISWKGTIILILLILFLRSTFFNWYIVPSSSMNPILMEGDITTVNLISYDLNLPFIDSNINFSDPDYSDIVAIKLDQFYVKRIIAKPNDTIKMINNVVYINNKPLQQSKSNYDISNLESIKNDKLYFSQKKEKYNSEYELIFAEGHMQDGKLTSFPKEIRDSIISNFDEIKLGNDEYFVLGDNRNNSKDSRFLGTIKRDQIVGKINYVLFNKNSFNRFITKIQ